MTTSKKISNVIFELETQALLISENLTKEENEQLSELLRHLLPKLARSHILKKDFIDWLDSWFWSKTKSLEQDNRIPNGYFGDRNSRQFIVDWVWIDNRWKLAVKTNPKQEMGLLLLGDEQSLKN